MNTPRCLLRSLALLLILGLCACSSDDNDESSPQPPEEDTFEPDLSGEDEDLEEPDTPPNEPDLPPENPEQTTVILDDVRISSWSEDENFHRATRTFEIPEGTFAEATLIVDLGTTCFPFESWQNNPPPEGENYPANCDAFDRNFDIIFDAPENEGDAPGLEMMHAITPFGGPMHLELDITDAVNGMGAGEHTVTVHIPTWSDGNGQISGSHGGWNVSASLYTRKGQAPRNVLAVIPVLRTGIKPEHVPLEATFEVPEGAREVVLEYRTSGHGGGDERSPACIGHADEFCRRTHRLKLDEEEFVPFIPWRRNCEDFCTLTRYGTEAQGFDYCMENPTGSIQSVQAPRANWCPGSLTEPFVYRRELAPGEHTFSVEILDIHPDGVWNTALTAIVFGEP